jgi:Spy/CpxP family protein refolding chaperone
MKVKLMSMLAGAIALSAVVAPFAVNAQNNPSVRPLLAQGQQRQGKWSKLNLTDAQKDQMRQIKEETRAKMQAVLTSDQQAKLQTLMQERKAQNGQGSNPQARRNIMAELNLTDEQKAQMREIMQEQKARMDEVLTAEQKQEIEQMRQQWQQQRQQRQQGS